MPKRKGERQSSGKSLIRQPDKADSWISCLVT